MLCIMLCILHKLCPTVFYKPRRQPPQGGVRAALGRIREACTARARELGEEALALEERLYSQQLAAQDRAEDASRLATEARASFP